MADRVHRTGGYRHRKCPGTGGAARPCRGAGGVAAGGDARRRAATPEEVFVAVAQEVARSVRRPDGDGVRVMSATHLRSSARLGRRSSLQAAAGRLNFPASPAPYCALAGWRVSTTTPAHPGCNAVAPEHGRHVRRRRPDPRGRDRRGQHQRCLDEQRALPSRHGGTVGPLH